MRRHTPQAFKWALAGWALVGFTAGLLLVSFGPVKVPRWLPSGSAPSAATQPGTQPIVFGSDAGLVLNYIKPSKTVAFDFMVGQLKAAMQENRQSVLWEEAARWKIVRTNEAGPNGTAVYVFAIDPPPRHVDYRIATVVAEAIHRNPDEFYRRLVDLYAAPQSVIDMAAVWPVRAPDVDRVLARSKGVQ